MARNASGTYTRVSNSFSDPVVNTTISPSDAISFFDDMETEITDSLSRSGKGGMSATAVLKIADGTSAAPALTFNDDTDTGIVRTTANTMVIAASGVAVITVQASMATIPNITVTGGVISGITDLAVADGGTGASTATSARSNLGLGTIATQDANNVNITGGTISGVSVGGTVQLPRGYIVGFATNNNTTDSSHDIDIATGTARDSTNAADITLASALTKRIDASWAVGTDQGGLDGSESSAGTPDANTWYYIHAIRRSDTGVVDVLFSESPTAPTMPTNYDSFRRIGAVLTDGSANILPYTQVNDHWYWATAIRDINDSSTSTTPETGTLSVPRVLGVKAFGAITAFAGGAFSAYIYPAFLTTTAKAGYVYNWAGSSSGGSIPATVAVDSSGQVEYESSASGTTLVFDTAGWIDPL